MSQVCRTCLKIIENNSQVFSIEFNDPTLDNVHIKAKLEACVPEIVLNRVKNSVICNYCLNALNSAYAFKVKCLESEKKIFRFITYSTMNCIDLTTFMTKFNNNYYNQTNGHEAIQRQFSQQANQSFTPHPSLLPSSFTKPSKLLHPSLDYTVSPPATPSKPYLHTSWPNHVNTPDIIARSRPKPINETPKVALQQHQDVSMLYTNFSESRTPELPFRNQSNRELPPLVAAGSLHNFTNQSPKPRNQHQTSFPLLNSQLQAPDSSFSNYLSQQSSQSSSEQATKDKQAKAESSSPTQNCPPLSLVQRNSNFELETSPVDFRNSVTPRRAASCEADSSPINVPVQHSANEILQLPFHSAQNCQLEQPAIQKPQTPNCKLEKSFPKPQGLLPPFQSPPNCQLEQSPPLFHSPQSCQLETGRTKTPVSSFNVPQATTQPSDRPLFHQFPSLQFARNSSSLDLPLQHEPRVSVNHLLGNSDFMPSMGMNGPQQFFPSSLNHRPTQSQVYPPFSHLRPALNPQGHRLAQNSLQFSSQANQLLQPNFPFQETFRPQLSQPGLRYQNSPSQYQPFLPNPFAMSQHHRSSMSPYPSASSIQPTYQQANRRFELNHRSSLQNGSFGVPSYRPSLSNSPRMALHYQNSLYGANRPDSQSAARPLSPPQSNHMVNSSSSSSSPSPSAPHYPAPPLFHSASRPSMSLLRSCLSSFQTHQSSQRLPTTSPPPLFPMLPNQELNGLRMNIPNSFLYHFTNNKEPLHSCAICRASFTTQELLQEHFASHESLKCNFCNFQTYLGEAYQEHLAAHKDELEKPTEVVETIYTCNQCEFSTTSKVSLEEHRFKHEPVVYKCQICNFKSIHASSLRRHKKIHINGKEFKCRRCDVACQTYEDLLSHMTEVHTEENSDGETEESNDKQVDPYQVSIDDIQNIIKDDSDLIDDCEQSDSLIEQDEMFDDVNSYMITAADLEKIMNEDKDTDTEMGDAQGEPNGSNEVKTIFNCKVCRQPFQFKYQLKKHMIIHSVAKQILECRVCEYRTTTKSHLQVHMNTHTGGTTYQCDQCDYCTVYSSNLEKHKRVHTGEKPYKCDYCDYSVTKLSRLRLHLESHAKEGLYKCKECSFEADNEDNLLNHQVIHNYGKHFLQDQVEDDEEELCENQLSDDLVSVSAMEEQFGDVLDTEEELQLEKELTDGQEVAEAENLVSINENEFAEEEQQICATPESQILIHENNLACTTLNHVEEVYEKHKSDRRDQVSPTHSQVLVNHETMHENQIGIAEEQIVENLVP